MFGVHFCHHPNESPIEPLRLLIADDHPAIIDAVSRFLEDEQGIEVVASAQDGDEALRLIEELDPDVAVLDVRMPELDGIEVARRLSKKNARTGVILYTGNPERSVLIEALDVGARGFLLKEGPLTDLSRAIRTVAEGGTFVDASLAGDLVSPDATAKVPGLTKREREVLRLLADGMRNEEAGQRLSISPLTVRTHVMKAMKKLEADTRTQAVANALRQSLIH
ncbi:MAG TPA: response regulator transcription factor [Gaiellaceae bacterium]|nr:response regulator transcription factor [Gaiellaceae bacterium]